MRTVGSSEEGNPVVSYLSELIIILEGIAEHICSVTINVGEETTNSRINISSSIQNLFACSIFGNFTIAVLANEWMIKSFLDL
jgi:hypothetical protein